MVNLPSDPYECGYVKGLYDVSTAEKWPLDPQYKQGFDDGHGDRINYYGWRGIQPGMTLHKPLTDQELLRLIPGDILWSNGKIGDYYVLDPLGVYRDDTEIVYHHVLIQTDKTASGSWKWGQMDSLDQFGIVCATRVCAIMDDDQATERE